MELELVWFTQTSHIHLWLVNNSDISQLYNPKEYNHWTFNTHTHTHTHMYDIWYFLLCWCE